MTRFRPEEHGAVGDGKTDDFPAFQAAFTAAVAIARAGGTGVVSCDPSRNYYFGSDGGYLGGGLSLPANLPGFVIVDGGATEVAPGLTGATGARITFSANNWRFVDFRYAADYQTFGNIVIRGFFFDRNGVSQPDHCAIGHFINGRQGARMTNPSAPTDENRMNFANIAVIGCKGTNMPNGPHSGSWVWFNTIQDKPGEATQNTQINIFIDRCDFVGGETGFGLGGGSYSSATAGRPIGMNVWWDNIWCFDSTWSRGAPPDGSTLGVGFQIGSAGAGGGAGCVRCTAQWSNDVNFELDGLQHTLLDGCVSISAWRANYTHNNYNGQAIGPYTNSDDQVISYRSCRSERYAAFQSRGFSTGLGGDGTQTTSRGSQLGTIIYEDCISLYDAPAPLGRQQGGFYAQQNPKILRLSNCQDTYRNWVVSVPGRFSYQAIQVAPGANPASSQTDIQIRGFSAICGGAASNGAPSHEVFGIGGVSFALLIDGVEVQQSILGTAGYTIPAHAYVAISLASGNLQGGRITRVAITKTTNDDPRPQGVVVGSSSVLTISSPLYIENCDFSRMRGTAVPIAIPDATNQALVHTPRNVWPATPPQSHPPTPAIGDAYQNLAGYDVDLLITGGNSRVAKSSDGGKTFSPPFTPANPVRLQHTDTLKLIAYRSAPTLTIIPAAK